MATRELLALAEQVEGLMGDAQALPALTGDADLDASVRDFRAVWRGGDQLDLQTLDFWD